MAIAHEREYPVVYFDYDYTYVTLRKGASVAQDDSYFTWEDDTMVFKCNIVNTQRDRCRLVAPEYGEIGNIGNGPLFADIIDTRRIT